MLWLGLGLRLCLLPIPPSDDMPRYIWEGRMVGMGFNTWKLPPDAPELAGYRDGNWQGINHKNFPTIYPPLAEGVFAALAAIRPSPFFFKTAFVACDVAAFLILLRLLRRRNRSGPGQSQTDAVAAVYFLNPLLLLEVAVHGHYDSLMLLALMACVAALERGRTAWAAFFMFLGASVKILSLAMLPLLVLRRPLWRGLVYSALMVAALGVMLQLSGAAWALRKFAVDFQYNSAFPFLLHAVTGPLLSRTAERALLALLFLAACVTAMLRLRPREGDAGARPPSLGSAGKDVAPASEVPAPQLRVHGAEREALVFLGLLLLFSPTLHPWYLLWILPFAAWRGNRPWLLLTGTIAVTYAVYAQAAATGHWREIPWLRLPEFLPPLLLWLAPKMKSRPVR